MSHSLSQEDDESIDSKSDNGVTQEPSNFNYRNPMKQSPSLSLSQSESSTNSLGDTEITPIQPDTVNTEDDSNDNRTNKDFHQSSEVISDRLSNLPSDERYHVKSSSASSSSSSDESISLESSDSVSSSPSSSSSSSSSDMPKVNNKELDPPLLTNSEIFSDIKSLSSTLKHMIQSEFDKAMIEDTHSTGAFRSLNATPTIEQVFTVDEDDAVEMTLQHENDQFSSIQDTVVGTNTDNAQLRSTQIPDDSTNLKSPEAPVMIQKNDIQENVFSAVRGKFDGLFEKGRRSTHGNNDSEGRHKDGVKPKGIEGSSHSSKQQLQQQQQQQQQTINKEALRKQFQQSISAAVMVSLAHKRYERRRLAAMEVEKVVRNLILNREMERVKGIILLLSDDYIRSTNEDARKGGAVSMAACAIGLKKAKEIQGINISLVTECHDLILASVVHACLDNMQRVRYYATESLFNVIKVLPHLAVDHFFILFEILRSLFADVDVDVRSGAEMLDKQLKMQIVTAINAGQFNADTCIPLFARYLTMKNKPTKKLTLMWLKEFSDKLVGAPLLEFLHLFLCDVFAILADPHPPLLKEALQFLTSILPKLIIKNEDFEDGGDSYNKIDFDKILQSLVTTMEHPNPFVRKVAMYWVSRIVQAHIGNDTHYESSANDNGDTYRPKKSISNQASSSSVSVRNALPHVLPGLLLCIGDTFEIHPKDEDRSRDNTKESFLPDQTTHSLAEQTNASIQKNIRRDSRAYVPYLADFISALKEELDTPGGLSAKNRSAKEYEPYRKDLKSDGTGVESEGWYRTNEGLPSNSDHESIYSRLCALDWVVLLFEHVVPDSLKDEFTDEFIPPLIRLIDDSPEVIVLKSLENLSKITTCKGGKFDLIPALSANSSKNQLFQVKGNDKQDLLVTNDTQTHPMTDANAGYALGVLASEEKLMLSRNREVFAAIIRSHAANQNNMTSLSRIIRHMCALQPPEFIYVSFGLELDQYINRTALKRNETMGHEYIISEDSRQNDLNYSKHLSFATKFAQILSNVLLTSNETKRLRSTLKGCIAHKANNTRDERRAQLFHIILKTFAHDCVAAISLCLWSGAFRTASTYIHRINPLDLDLNFYLELDRLIEFIERPMFRDLHLCLLECDENPDLEGSGAMLYRVLKSILMLLPQSTSYSILNQRLMAVARFRQSAVHLQGMPFIEANTGTSSDIYVHRILEVRKLHCESKWCSIRSESLEPTSVTDFDLIDVDASRRHWLGYENEEDEKTTREQYLSNHRQRSSPASQDDSYFDFAERKTKPEKDACASSDRDNDDIDDEAGQEPVDNVGETEGPHTSGIDMIDEAEDDDDESDDAVWKQTWANSN